MNLIVFDLEKLEFSQLAPKQFISVQMLSEAEQISIGYAESAGKLIFGVKYLADNNEFSIGWFKELTNPRSFVSCRFSKNGRIIVLREYRETSNRNVFAIRNTVTGELIQDISPSNTPTWVRSYELSGDATRIYSIDEKYLYEQNVDTGNVIRQIANPNGKTCIDLVMHPNWKIMMSAHEGGKSINVWDTDTLELKTTFAWPLGNFSCITISPDGLIAAAGNAHGKVVVWDLDDI